MDAAERIAWLRLTLTPDVGPRTARALLAAFGLPTAIFQASAAALGQHVPEKLARTLSAPPEAALRAAIDAAETWLARDPAHALLTLADADYPQALLAIADPPPVLFAIGRRELLNRPAFAIVGSRNATRQGEANAEAFAQALARAGLTIVSGLALGIDAAAHRGALKADTDASTIAVVGTGADVIYPAANKALALEIRRRGVVISELAPGTPGIAHNFPRRNRLIAGLARGVLVVEATLRSGSLITARLAADAGREVFAVPGSIHSPLSKGCHKLIKEGAKLAESAPDVLEELNLAGAAAATAAPAAELTSAQAALLDALGFDPVDLDALALRTGRDAGGLTADLLELELSGHVERLPGNRYQRLR